MKFCKKCQTETERNASGACKPCARARNTAYLATHPERRAATTAAYRAANKGRIAASSADWYVANAEIAKVNGAAYYAANHEKMKARHTAWRKANPERKKALSAAWRNGNPEKIRVYSHNRRARKRADGGKLSPGLAETLFKLQRGKCPCCGQSLGDDYHMDHIMPIALGGTNTDDNIQLLRSTCNKQKNAKHPVYFMRQRGFLI